MRCVNINVEFLYALPNPICGCATLTTNDESLFFFPNYTRDIITLILKKEWLIHNFNCKNKVEAYNPTSYLYNKKFDNWKYTLILDTNIYDFLLKSVKKSSESEQCKTAIALLVFCQLSSIEIDASFAVHEKLKEDNLDEIIQDLELFYKLNNSDTNELTDYALGKSVKIELNNEIKFNHDEIRNKLIRCEKPDEWESLYLMILKITVIYMDDSSRKMKLSYFIDWLLQDFRMGLPAIVYALLLFGKSPVSKMMKYKNTESRDKKIQSLNNMTWDLFIIKDFFKKWTGKQEREEFIFASDDKAFSKILNLAVQVQMNGNFEPCKSYLNELEFKKLTDLLNEENHPKDRVYKSHNWNSNYRDKLILECKNKLGISHA